MCHDKFNHQNNTLHVRFNYQNNKFPRKFLRPYQQESAGYLIALRKAARGIDSLNNVILFSSIQLKRSKGLKLFDLDESVSEAISSTVRYKLTPDGAVPIEVSKHDE